jgi:hypothetical protein
MVAAIRSDAGASRWLVRAALERRRDLLIEYEAVMTASASKTPMPTGSHEHWAQLTGETLTAYPDLD